MLTMATSSTMPTLLKAPWSPGEKEILLRPHGVDPLLGNKPHRPTLDARLPATPVSPDERRLVEKIARRFRISLAVVARASYFCAGVLDEMVLTDLPDDLADFIRKHHRFPGEGDKL